MMTSRLSMAILDRTLLEARFLVAVIARSPAEPGA